MVALKLQNSHYDCSVEYGSVKLGYVGNGFVR